MIVTLIGENSLNRLILPHEATGNYWLCDKSLGNDKKLINIEANNGKWQFVSTSHSVMISNKYIRISKNKVEIPTDINDEITLDKVILNNYGMYCIKLKNEDEPYLLYCTPICENNYLHLKMKSDFDISVGSDKRKNHIVLENILVSPIHIKLHKNNGNWDIQNYNKIYNTYVNDLPVGEQTRNIKNGDIIFVLGTKIIVMGNDIFVSNPSGKVKYNSKFFDLVDKNPEVTKKDDEELINGNNESDYFLRPPRMIELAQKNVINIEMPVKENKDKGLPIILVMGSMFSFAAMTIISIIQTLDEFINGEVSKKNAIFSLIMASIMLLGSLLLPLITQQYTTNREKKKKLDRDKKYRNYIQNKIKEIDENLLTNKKILNDTYPSADECLNIILEKDARLWERKSTDRDFLNVKLGIGNIQSNLEVSINRNTKSFEDENTEFDKLAEDCIKHAKILNDAPVLLSFINKRFSAIIADDDNENIKFRFIQNIILQLITFHSYDELKLVFLLKDNSSRSWDFTKILPHTWNSAKNLRFFAYDYTKIKEVSQFLSSEIKKRKSELEDSSSEDKVNIGMPYYLIIVEDYKRVENISAINEILKSERNLGFSLLMITDNINYLPNECKTFISLDSEKGILFGAENAMNNQIEFKIEEQQDLQFDDVSKVLFNIPIKYAEEKEMQLPSSYNFLEMFNVGCIEQLNILQRWKTNDSTVSLAAPIGIDGSGNIIELDLHEKFHGPHGLIAGSTGSGKSEFIITYILSLAVNYHPDDVTFVLIDYKGGGLTGAFKKPTIQLPHLVGTITNIDKSGLERSLESIESELKRRQIEFNEAKNITNESTMDIYKYQKYYHQGVLKDPISHLFIISDEFAELKEQEPEFIDELVSIARIGRSLGVHLILATQKPSGVVNDQIRSNSKFGVCLKVQTPSDSQDVIDIGDGAKLKGAGQFYLKVGNDDYLVLGQAAWAGAKYYPSNEVKKEYDNSVEFISSTGMILKKVDDEIKRTEECKGEQITNIVDYLCELADKADINEKQLWLENIPETIYLEDIRKKYNVKNDKNITKAVIGEYDNPSKQTQNVKMLDFSNDGNVVIYGNAKSGKETLISTLIYDIISNYTPDEVNIYIMDFGSEATKIFRKAPQVGDIIFASEVEKLTRFFIMLRDEIKTRKEKLSDYNGDYRLFLNTNKEPMPSFVVILNNYEVYLENYEMRFDELFETLIREGEKCGIYFAVTAGNGSAMRYRMSQNFKQKIALQLNSDDELFSIFDQIGKKRAGKLFGRGLIFIEEEGFFEFQTAKICEANVWNDVIADKIEALNKMYKNRAKSIPTLPEVVSVEDVKKAITTVSSVPLGIVQKSLKPCTYNLNRGIINLIVTRSQTVDIKNFINSFIEIFKLMPNINFDVFDADKILSSDEEDLRQKYFDFFKALNHSEKEIDDSVYIIIGLQKFLDALEAEELFFESLKNAERLKKCRAIIIDNYSNIEKYEDSEWYEKYITKNYGLWIGNGAEAQGLIEITEETGDFRNDCGQTFGYAVKKGRPTLIKVLGMEEKSEEDE
ncbi:MAG: type VII secretion protein EssC [Clostridia bacterium]|nr:type VII secretion protein EssC [Clostridia bacterium]